MAIITKPRLSNIFAFLLPKSAAKSKSAGVGTLITGTANKGKVSTTKPGDTNTLFALESQERFQALNANLERAWTPETKAKVCALFSTVPSHPKPYKVRDASTQTGAADVEIGHPPARPHRTPYSNQQWSAIRERLAAPPPPPSPQPLSSDNARLGSRVTLPKRQNPLRGHVTSERSGLTGAPLRTVSAMALIDELTNKLAARRKDENVDANTTSQS